MRCRLACMGVVLGIATLACGPSARAEGIDAISEPSPWSAPVYHTDTKAPPAVTHSAKEQKRPQETPTAPLPRALWPGLMILVALGIVRISVGAARRAARR